ncbi:MAG: efflux RND transporter permease subunit, partial [Longimicrobiales bacterium]
MLRAIVASALRLRVAVIVLALLALVGGPSLVRQTPLDVFPEFAPPLVEIQTEAPGLSTEEVERLVTIPIENAVIGTSWLETLRSKSVLGLSSVVVIFESGTDLLEARQLVQERIAQVEGLLPAVAKPPVLLSPLSSLSRVMKIGVTSPTLSQTELTTLVKWTIRPRLMAISGVANVAIWGQRDRQIQVLVDPDRLRAHHVSLTEVVDAARAAGAVGGGGFMDTPNQRFAVTQRSAVHGPMDVAQTVVAFRNGASLRLGDVADVVEGFPPMIGDAVINDVPGLLLIVEKQPWGNTLEVTRRVEEAIDAMRPGLQGVDLDPTIFRPATFIEMSIGNLRTAMILACILVTLVLALFLHDWRTTVISVLAIPLSLLAAVLVLKERGGTMDTMVLAGLVIALGEVVDDAIIDVENIMRRLRLNASVGLPQSAFRVVLEASLEVRGAVVYGSLIVALVLLPVFFMGGLAGSFFEPLALAYVLAILASLAVALTVTPALSYVLLPRAVSKTTEAPLVRWLKRHYRTWLPRFISRREKLPIYMAAAFVLT